VRPGENGWLVPPGDATALCGALKQAIVDREALRQLGVRSRGIVEAEFAWTAVAAATEALYRRLLAPTAAREATGGLDRPKDTT
jgi:glycosyltransferase involved in cell wall biosynthesis